MKLLHSQIMNNQSTLSPTPLGSTRPEIPDILPISRSSETISDTPLELAIQLPTSSLWYYASPNLPQLIAVQKADEELASTLTGININILPIAVVGAPSAVIWDVSNGQHSLFCRLACIVKFPMPCKTNST